MNVVGIIAEYNPFHNGHLYHLDHAKKTCTADYVICVMSGHFLQRGEPALFDKWSRAAMAVSAGADLVLELPFAFACRSAGAFARGSVELLSATKLVTHLCFGSEADSIEQLKDLASFLTQEPPLYQQLIRKNLKLGLSYPSARSRAIQEYYVLTNLQNADDIQAIIASPNNILGIEYLAALHRIHSPITPTTIKRQHTNYHDQSLSGSIASATAIRTEFETKGLTEELERTMPDTTNKIAQQCFIQQLGPVFPNAFAMLIIAILRRAQPAELSAIAEVTEGLEHKLKSSGNIATNLDDLLKLLKSKRFTRTRLQRMLIYIMLNFTKELAAEFDHAGPRYLRVLAISKQGQNLLRILKETAALPIIQRAAEFTASNYYNPTSTLDKMLQLDIHATDLYALGSPVPRRGGLDYLTSVVRMSGSL